MEKCRFFKFGVQKLNFFQDCLPLLPPPAPLPLALPGPFPLPTPLPLALPGPLQLPLATSFSSPCSNFIPVAAVTRKIGAWWNSPLLFITMSTLLEVIWTVSFICLWRQLLPYKMPARCSSWPCFHRGLSSTSNLRLFWCSCPQHMSVLVTRSSVCAPWDMACAMKG